MRLIDADALIEELNNRIDEAIKWGVNAIADRDAEIRIRAEQAVASFCEASLTAKKMPTIDQVKRGRWVPAELDKTFVTCSVCLMEGYNERMAYRPDFANTLNYCPNCGAYMRGEEDEAD